MTREIRYQDDLELDLQSYQNDCDKVDTAILGVESIIQTQDILTDEGANLDATSLRLAEQSVECFLKMARIGMPSNKIIPSNESMAGKYEISQATLEGIGEGIKNVFMSIINAIKKAFEWMWGLIKRLFGRGKDHEEKVEQLKTESQEVKQKVKEMSEEEKKNAPFPRDADGWITKVTLDRPGVLKKIVTSKGLMTKEQLHAYMTEMGSVFTAQTKNIAAATAVQSGKPPENVNFEMAFHSSANPELTKQVTRSKDAKVYSSLEFGAGEYLYIVMPASKLQSGQSTRDEAKSQLRWVDELVLGKASITRVPDFEKFRVLEGEYANADKIIDMIDDFSKFLRQKTDELKTMQSAKERFLREFEAKIKKLGVNLFSSAEHKTERDSMMFYLKFFRKVMDQPAVMYYGECDAIITSFEHLAMYVLAYNRRNGNQVRLKADEANKRKQE
jgi:hypothetical protein